MGVKRLVPSRTYTAEFQIEALRLAESIGAAKAAMQLGIPHSSLWNWILKQRAGRPPAQGSAAPKRGQSELEAENNRLRRELANAKMDLEILKKAAAYFAKESRCRIRFLKFQS